jgi:hypothetical protein
MGSGSMSAPHRTTERPVHHGYPCEDFEFLCIVGVGGLIALIVVLATVKTGSVPQGAVTNSTP